jgi:hypothetical protein
MEKEAPAIHFNCLSSSFSVNLTTTNTAREDDDHAETNRIV